MGKILGFSLVYSLVLHYFNALDLTGFSGYRMRAGSASPDRRRNGSREYSPDYENSVSPPRDRGFGRW